MSFPGGKGRLWQRIVALIPPHDVYIETHLGGGAVMRQKRPASKNIGIDLDERVIAAAQSWSVPNLTLFQEDAIEFISRREFVGTEFIYVDPPYLSSLKSRKYYNFEYSDRQHCDLLSVLGELNCQVMISGYPSKLYESFLGDWHVTQLVNVSNAGQRIENVWTNYRPDHHLHDYSTVGNSFRERERIRRKAKRWARQLEEMPLSERSAILWHLLEENPGLLDEIKRISR